MNNITLKVTANRLEIVSDTFTTQGSVNYDGCVFSFDSIWNGFSKTAVFACDSTDSYRVNIENNMCKIPASCIRKEGILKIGVYGISDDGVVITTNSVAHRVNEGVGEVDEWIEEDTSLVVNALKELESSYEEYLGSLDTRFNNLLDMVRENGAFSEPQSSKGEPDDWYSPTTFADAENIPSSTKSSDYSEYFDYILNGLTADFPDFVSCKTIGTDASGVYPIYAYTFAPLNYEKTVLVCAESGSVDSVAVVALSYFLDELCRNYDSDRTLTYLRSKVKLVVLPAVNPYGLINKRYYNSNSVSINRNFPFKWDECTDGKKGTAACDQNETMAVVNLAQELAADKLCAVLDINSCTNLYCSKLAFYPRFKNNCIKAVSSVINRYNYEETDETDVLRQAIFAPSVNPTLTNYLAEEYGINACAINWSSVNFGGSNSNQAITKFTEYIGNMLYALAKNSSYTLKGALAPFTKHISWRSTDENDFFEITATESFEKVPISSYELPIKTPCNITLSGYVLLKIETACTVKINPILWQTDSPEQGYSERLAMTDFSIEIPLSVGTHVIPINSVLQGYYSDTNGYVTTGYPEKVRFAIAVCCDNASCTKVVGFSAMLNAYCSDVGKSVEISRPMGVSGDYTDEDDVPTQELVYPLETVTSKDRQYDD